MKLTELFEIIYSDNITNDVILLENIKTKLDNIKITQLLNIDKDLYKQFMLN